jgi:hypothetical protein
VEELQILQVIPARVLSAALPERLIYSNPTPTHPSTRMRTHTHTDGARVQSSLHSRDFLPVEDTFDMILHSDITHYDMYVEFPKKARLSSNRAQALLIAIYATPVLTQVTLVCDCINKEGRNRK